MSTRLIISDPNPHVDTCEWCGDGGPDTSLVTVSSRRHYATTLCVLCALSVDAENAMEDTSEED